jgi:hypothetical protein
MTAMTGRSITDRMRGAALLDVPTYEEVEHDETATGQAAVVVALYAVAAAIGNVGHGGRGIIGAIVGAFVGWVLWSGVTYLGGGRVFKGTATWGEMLRAIGFAMSPGVLLVLGIIPILGGLVRLVVGIWILVTGVIAIRQALDFTTGKALLTALLGWLVMVVVGAVLGGLGAMFT